MPAALRSLKIHGPGSPGGRKLPSAETRRFRRLGPSPLQARNSRPWWEASAGADGLLSPRTILFSSPLMPNAPAVLPIRTTDARLILSFPRPIQDRNSLPLWETRAGARSEESGSVRVPVKVARSEEGSGGYGCGV